MVQILNTLEEWVFFCQDQLLIQVDRLLLRDQFELEEKWFSTWQSKGFGKRIERRTLQLSGVINQGIHKFKNI